MSCVDKLVVLVLEVTGKVESGRKLDSRLLYTSAPGL